MNTTKKINYKQVLVMTFFMASLSACDIPFEPEGINRQGMAHIGDNLLAQGDVNGAADFYQRSLERVPKDGLTRAKLAAILESKGDLNGAAAQYDEAIKYETGNADIYKGYGRVLVKLSQPAAARDMYEEALRINSSDAKAANGLGVALDMLDNHTAAQKVYQDALHDDPNNMSLVNNLAHSYVLSGNFTEAIRLLEPYADDAKASLAVRQNLAEAYGLAGMNADAERVARKDLPPSEVKHNLAAYKARSKKLTVVKGYYADLGSYPTKGMVDARVAYLKSDMAGDIEGLIIDDSSAVTSIGGTPSFALKVKGFGRVDKAASFCAKLKEIDQQCKVVSGD